MWIVTRLGSRFMAFCDGDTYSHTNLEQLCVLNALQPLQSSKRDSNGWPMGGNGLLAVYEVPVDTQSHMVRSSNVKM